MATSTFDALSDSEAPSKRRSTIEVGGTWDIETEAWDKFVCGAIYAPGEKEAVKVYPWSEEEAFVDELLTKPRTLWAHNGGRFDTLWLLGHVLKRGLRGKIGLSGSSVASLEVDGVTFRDSARLAPMTLAKFSEIGSERKAPTELPCTCGTACGGYCAISRGMAPALFRRLVEYLVQDCKALYSALDAVSTLAERWDLDLRPTIGACAWATVLRTEGVEKADWGKGVRVTPAYENVRRAYYGGRVQVMRPRSAHGAHYDLNSAYPAALAALSLPIGQRSELDARAAGIAYGDGGDGAFRASVHVPHDLFFPPLPIRAGQRVCYPTGRIDGWWTGLELRQAETRGVRMERVHQGVVWEASAPVLANFCRRVWKLRDEASPKTALGAFLKNFANSLTGKLASKPVRETICIDPTRPILCPGGACKVRSPLCGVFGCCDHRCTGKCGKATPVAAGFPVFSIKTPQLSTCSHVEWAAHLTAFTRRELQRFAGEGDDIVYCDTDSLFCESPRTERIGAALGEWKLEDNYSDFAALAPKTYHYTDADSGKLHAAAKGIPDAVNNIFALMAGKAVVNDRGVNTFKRAMQTGQIFSRRSLSRELRGDGLRFGDRTLHADGKTYPPKAEDLGEL